jgi:multidrug resistance efflux pump
MKRQLSAIQSDIERAEEEARLARQRLDSLREEKEKNDTFQRQQVFRALLNDDALYGQLFEGSDALLDLNLISLDKAKKTVDALKRWKDSAVAEAVAAQSRLTRTVVKTEELTIDDPYDGRTHKSYVTTYSDGTSEWTNC